MMSRVVVIPGIVPDRGCIEELDCIARRTFVSFFQQDCGYWVGYEVVCGYLGSVFVVDGAILDHRRVSR